MTLLEYIQSFEHITSSIHINKVDGKTDIYVDYNDIWKKHEDGDFTTEEYDILDRLVDSQLDFNCKNWVTVEQAAREPNNTPHFTEYQVKCLTSIEIVIDEEVKEYYATARKPYYRSRGTPITPEQARQIKEEIEIWHLEHMPHNDGNINSNTIMSCKLPNWYELISDAIMLKMAIPDLDCMIAISDWNELPDYAWKIWPFGKWEEKHYGEYPGFLDHIEYGIWIHGSTLEFMNPTRAREQYIKYDKLHGGK